MQKQIITNSGNYSITEIGDTKRLQSSDYNYFFNKKTGFFARWGAEEKDNPAYS
jgi:hypothetical protein